MRLHPLRCVPAAVTRWGVASALLLMALAACGTAAPTAGSAGSSGTTASRSAEPATTGPTTGTLTGAATGAVTGATTAMTVPTDSSTPTASVTPETDAAAPAPVPSSATDALEDSLCQYLDPEAWAAVLGRSRAPGGDNATLCVESTGSKSVSVQIIVYDTEEAAVAATTGTISPVPGLEAFEASSSSWADERGLVAVVLGREQVSATATGFNSDPTEALIELIKPLLS